MGCYELIIDLEEVLLRTHHNQSVDDTRLPCSTANLTQILVSISLSVFFFVCFRANNISGCYLLQNILLKTLKGCSSMVAVGNLKHVQKKQAPLSNL